MWLRSPSEQTTRFFGDTKHGSSDSALRAAREYRDAYFQKRNAPLIMPFQTPKGPARGCNKLGLTGVHLVRSSHSGRGWRFNALVRPDLGREGRQQFSVAQHGFDNAFWLAVRFRERGTGLLFSNEALRDALKKARAIVESSPL
ncbi:hypothetical protein IWX58_004890 [Rubrivivax gelatinosus]|nr:hypothetical protein [Rubrivivax gelatinosus]